MRRIKFFLVIPLFLMIVFYSSFLLQTTDPGNNILKNLLFKLENYYNWYPQQKVYLHTDKNNYDISETLWLKAYVLNATSHKPDSSNTNLYVELIGPGGKIVQQKLLLIDKGFSNGDFSFKDTLQEGMYRIRAYTSWMLNDGEDFLFTKDIYISNPEYTTYATRETIRTVRKENKGNIKKAENYDVSFYPEGGHLLKGVKNKIGFKAINELGLGVNISGVIVDKKGVKVAEFTSTHLGMGFFYMNPQSDSRYTAIINAPDGKESKFILPEIIKQGVSLYCENQTNENLKVGISSTFSQNTFPPNTKYYLIAHSRGNPVYTSTLDLKNENNEVVISKSVFPSGVIHFTLFNSSGNPVSERLVFINNDDVLKINILPDKTVPVQKEKINLKIKVADISGKPVKGNFSLSIAKVNDITNQDNILVNLLLSSDIKGKIEDPAYYFKGYDEKKENELDNLLLTQGWRRFNWQTVLQNVDRPVRFPKENKLTITGRINKEFFGVPLKDALVTLSILNQFNDVYNVRSGYDGQFKFEGLEYYDTLSVKIEAERRTGRKNLLILIDFKSTEPVIKMNYITYQYLKKPGPQGKYKKQEEVLSDDPYFEENSRIDRIHSEPRDVIIVDERFLSYSNVAQILQGRVPGVMVTGYKVIIRGISTLSGSTDPLFLVDNIQVDPYTALSIIPNEVDRIEILKGADAAVYGSRGGNGVIVVYTKRGKFYERGIVTFKMLGYSTPKEYYVPKYPQKDNDIFIDDRKTILWLPYLYTDSNGEADVSFYTSNITGRYRISTEGINYKGIPGAAEYEFIVK